MSHSLPAPAPSVGWNLTTPCGFGEKGIVYGVQLLLSFVLMWLVPECGLVDTGTCKKEEENAAQVRMPRDALCLVDDTTGKRYTAVQDLRLF